MRATVVELTAAFGLGEERHLRPIATDAGPILWPLDREIVALVWGEGGYPASPAYRDYYHRTAHDHRLWRNDGDPYDPEAARALVAVDAQDFVGRVRERVAGGGVSVCAVDTELLGHWWYEGVQWLAAVIDEAARQGLTLTTLDDALDRYEPAPAPPEALGVSSWGEGEDLAPGVAPRSPISPGSCAPPSSKRSRSARGPATARCGSCSRCRPATGRSSPPRGSPGSTRANGPSAMPMRWPPRWRATRRSNPG